jgi:uncharacterized membrane protein YhaH (DUF805 family)
MFKEMFTLSWNAGRLNRLRYLWLVVASFALWIGALFIYLVVLSLAGINIETSASFGGIALPILPFYFLLLWVQLCLSVKRFQDLNLSGLWALAVLGISLLANYFLQMGEGFYSLSLGLYIITVLAAVALLCWPGTEGENNFGEDPRYL